jgi:predicted metalloprotease with PDZ domain
VIAYTHTPTGGGGGYGTGVGNESEAKKQYGLGVTFKKSDGLGGMLVKRVKAYGAAASTGALDAGDRVLSINGMPLDQVTDALHLSKLTHGEALSVAVLSVVRLDGREEEVVIVRGES